MYVERRKLPTSFKIWLGGKRGHILGEGGACLLRSIERYGSISKAAKEIGISYRFAWNQLAEMEKTIGSPVIVRKRGGATRGGAELTGSARRMLLQYETMKKYLGRAIQDEYGWEAVGLKLSARNRIKGIVKEVNKGKVTSTVKMEVNVPASITAVITKEAVEDLQIKPGDIVEAIIKATEVMIAKE